LTRLANPRISVRDQFGNVANSTVVVSASIGAGAVGAIMSGTTSISLTAGVGNFTTLSLNKAFTGYTLDFASGGLATATCTAFNIVHAAASQLTLSTQPSTINAGSAISPSPVVSLFDALGNACTSDNASVVRCTIFSNPSTGSLRLTTAITTPVTQVDVTAVAGVVTFNNLTIDKVGNGYTLSFAGVSPVALTAVTSNPFAVNPGAPASATVATQPTNAVAGTIVSPFPSVQIKDQFGNNVTTDNATQVTATISTNPGTSTLGGNTTAQASGGVATFNNLTLNKTGTGYILTFTPNSFTGPVASSTFNITPAPAATMAVTAQPTSPATAGATIAGNPAVTLSDNFGNICTNDNATVVTVAIGTNPTVGSTLSGTVSKPVTAGVASFTNLSIQKSGVGFTLSFSANGITGVTSNAFTENPAAPAAISIVTPPGNGTAGSPFGQPVINVVDAFGNLCTNNSAVSITAAIGFDPNGTGISTINAASTVTIQITSGVASWAALAAGSQLRIDRAGAGFTLLFTGTAGVASATSTAFTIVHGAATKLAITTQPNNATAGQTFNTQPVIEVQDAFSNKVVTSSASVLAAFVLDGPGGGTGLPLGNTAAALSGSSTVSANTGIASFSNLRVDQAGVGFKLRFTSGVLTLIDSAAFTVLPGAPNQLTLSTQPAGARGGEVFDTQPVVQVKDAFGNVVTFDNTSVVTVALGNDPSVGTSGFTGTLTKTAVAGIATFTNLKINKAAAGYTLSFSVPGITNPAVSTALTVAIGAPKTLAVVTNPAGFRASISGVVQPLTTQPVVQAKDLGGNVCTNNSALVITAAIGADSTLGAAVLSGTKPQTVSAGVATWTDLAISTAGTFTLNFTAPGGVTSIASASFTLLLGPVALTTVNLDDRDNDGTVSARDLLQFQFDELLKVSSVPTANNAGQLDTALGLSGGATFGVNATAVVADDQKSIWVTLAAGETVSAGTTTSDPAPTIQNTNNEPDVTPTPINIGGPATDTFAPTLDSITANGGNPDVVGVGVYTIVATYSDDQTQPQITIVAPTP
jgi:hypothetical protein